jgi:C4-dicarboxylate transporter DctM subunit
MVAAVLFGTFLLLLLAGVPIYLSLGASALVAIVLLDLVPLQALPSQLFSSFNSFTLLAIPFFILAGDLLAKSAIADRLLDLARALVGAVRGGLAVVAVIVGIFFAGISGSGPADVGAQGSVLIPAMVRDRYPRAFASALIAANGAIGIIVPPSIGLIIYGVVANVSIGRLFIAGIVPGIVIGVSLAAVSMVLAARNDWGPSRRELQQGDDALLGAGTVTVRPVAVRGKDRVVLVGQSLRLAIWGLLAPIIILGGIYGGVFTPTEAAAVVAVYALFVGMVVYRDIKLRDLPAVFVASARTSGVVMIIIGSAAIFAFILNTQGIAAGVARTLTQFAPNAVVGLLMINLIILLAGTMLDAISIYYIFTPILLPVAMTFGVDPLHFGIIATVNLAIGQITPPVGVNLFVACAVGRVSVAQISRAVLPLVAIQIIALLIITFVPELSLWLPNLLDA